VLDTIRKTLHLLATEGKVQWVGVVALALLSSAVEAAAALLIFVLIGLISGTETEVALPLVGDLSQRFAGLPRETFMVWVAVAVIVFFILRAVVVVGQAYVLGRVTQNAGARLAQRLFRGYLLMPYPFHLARNSSEFIRNTQDTVRSITGEVIEPLVIFVSKAILALGLLGVLVLTAPLATGFAVVFLAPVLFVLLKVVQPRLKRWGRRRQQLMKANISTLQQAFHGIRDVKLLNAVPFFAKVHQRQRRAMARVNYLGRVVQELPSLMIETVLVVFIAVFFIVFIALEGRLSELLAILGMFAYVALRIKPALQKIVQTLTSLRFAAEAVDNAYGDLRLIEAQAEGGGEEEEAAAPPLRSELSVVDVTFAFPERPHPALRDVNLTIAAGEAVGIVGPTGGGKSTLLDIIAGLLQPTSGRVLIDGVPLEGREISWHHQMGVVSQAVFLIDGTLRENIALGVRDRDLDEARLASAVEVAQLSEFVASLPDGLDTLVGERGVRISGGQRQRVAIARALYRNAPVLILDEGTSALDNRTEAAFMESLHRTSEGRTIIMVAHRLTTVRGCDRIALIDEGRIVDVGTFDEVVSRNQSLVHTTEATRASG
jgi:ABC-type bacteriocin/lantibiotic exporter with double-glycine peptidase domain